MLAAFAVTVSVAGLTVSEKVFVGTVVSETIGANAGLGYQIALAGSNFQMPLCFSRTGQGS